jgi:hypothetical protein
VTPTVPEMSKRVFVDVTMTSMLRNYAHHFDFFVQCAEEFEAMCSNRKSSAEESHLIGVDEITSMK